MKAIKLVNKFAGEEDVERWIDTFELAVNIDNLKDKEAQYLSMFLSGLAYDTWKNLSAGEKKDATAIKSALRNAFGMRRLDAWRAAQSKRVHLGDSVDAIGDQITKCVSVAVAGGGNPLEYVKGLMLLEALPINIRDQVMLFLGNDLSYSEVLRAAKRIFPQGASVEIGAYGGVKTGNGKSESFQSYQQKPPRCNGCNRLGHFQKDCRVICHKCGQRGHLKYSCTAVPLNASQGAVAPANRQQWPQQQEQQAPPQQQHQQP